MRPEQSEYCAESNRIARSEAGDRENAELSMFFPSSYVADDGHCQIGSVPLPSFGHYPQWMPVAIEGEEMRRIDEARYLNLAANLQGGSCQGW